MPADAAHVRRCLKDFDFATLFIDGLGWNRYSPRPLAVSTADATYTLRAVAEKRGFVVLRCDPSADGSIPVDRDRQKIDRQATRNHHEHIIVYADTAKTIQVWQWVRREAGRPTRRREFTYRQGQSGEDLVQRLVGIAFAFEEEEKDEVTIAGVRRKVRKSFDLDRVTKRFYERFKLEREAFATFIAGIGNLGDRDWYASVMLNRLMFVYFIQRKGFLDGDVDYLRRRLEQVQAKRGAGQFLTFYRYFLLRLFHEGLGSQDRSPELEALLGKIPYLNGGIFDVHLLERRYLEIQVPDDAFERIFGFFDSYRWHLDERPLRDDDEINPDVLGYIFEKYVNQKEMGAYYTKEDITEYIAKSTIVPFLVDAARKDCAIAFQPASALWRLLEDDPDRYIYDAVQKGVGVPLPPEIEGGIADVARRGGWNRPADGGHALPTETWREHVSRRQRCLAIRAKLRTGEIQAIDDLITLNLDIRQFAQDAIEQCEGPELLRAFYQAIESVSVLDPTCGSGAFLFAALNILEPLYEACLERMEAFVGDLDRSGDRHRPERFSDFRRVLARVGEHPNRQYFILKSIVVNNLYGVDIMEEAVEICKLRLFLKLVAQIDRVDDLEPLPDVDFNVRAGNTLVGFARLSDVEQAIKTSGGHERLFLLPEEEGALREIGERAEIADRAFRKFHEMQIAYGMAAADFAGAKSELRGRLDQLRDELDRYLATQYRVEPKDDFAFDTWRSSHQPFHWCVEFYGKMERGGFDVIIGNPPYIEETKFSGGYTALSMRTIKCRDVYAWFVERSVVLAQTAGWSGLILPVSFSSSGSFGTLRDVVWETGAVLWLSHYANRPGQLFSGAQSRLTVLVRGPGRGKPCAYSTRYQRWDSKQGERDALLQVVEYESLGGLARAFLGLLPKAGTRNGITILYRLGVTQRLEKSLSPTPNNPVYWARVPGYFCQFFLTPPKARLESGGPDRIRGEVNAVYVAEPEIRRVLHALLNSSLFYYFFSAFSDGRHVNPSDVSNFPADPTEYAPKTKSALSSLSFRLEASMTANTVQRRKSGLLVDSVNSRQTKPDIDEIDRVLATHYGLTDEELDFIINYDIKYRMGTDAGEDD